MFDTNAEFTPGGYKEDRTVRGNLEKIVESLREKKYQTVSHLTKNTGLSADDVQTALDLYVERFLFRMVGFLQVYFLIENEPEGRLFNTGYNSFAVAEDGKIYTPPKRRRAPVREVVRSTSSHPRRQTVRPLSTIQIKLDKADVELFGFQGKGIRQIATELDIPHSSATFYLYSKNYPYRKKYFAGKERRRQMAEIRQQEVAATI